MQRLYTAIFIHLISQPQKISENQILLRQKLLLNNLQIGRQRPTVANAVVVQTHQH